MRQLQRTDRAPDGTASSSHSHRLGEPSPRLREYRRYAVDLEGVVPETGWRLLIEPPVRGTGYNHVCGKLDNVPRLLSGGRFAGRPLSVLDTAISRRVLERSRLREGEEMIRSHWAQASGALVLGLGLAAGCSDESSPVAPMEPIDPTGAAEVMPSVDDAADRLQLGILDAAVAASLSDHLDALQQHLAAGDRSAAQDAVVAAAQLLAQYVASGLGADAPDVTAIQLMLVHTATLVGAQLDAELVP